MNESSQVKLTAITRQFPLKEPRSSKAFGISALILNRDHLLVDVTDDLSSFRRTVLDVNKTLKSIKGIELGRGGFTIRGLAPVFAEDGKALGSVEVLSSFNQVLKGLAHNEGLAAMLFMSAKLLPITTNLQDPKKYPVIDGEFVLIEGQSNETMARQINLDWLRQGILAKTTQRVEHSAITLFPIKDYNDQPIGVLVMSEDVSASQNAVNTATYVFGMTILALILVPVVLVLVILRNSVSKSVAKGLLLIHAFHFQYRILDSRHLHPCAHWAICAFDLPG
jgi:methyl-accepting chemotaxis protein